MKTQGKVWIIYDAKKKTQTKPMSMVQAQVVLLSLAKKDHDKFFLWTPGWNEWVSIKNFLESDQRYFVLSQPPKPLDFFPEKTPVPFHDENMTATRSATTTQTESPYTQVIVGDEPLKEQKESEYYAKDFSGHELDLNKIAELKPEPIKRGSSGTPKTKTIQADGADRRRETRHNFKIEVVLVSKIRSFRTYSKNISLSGTMLEHEIPKDFLNRPFDLIIVNPFEPDQAKARLLFRAKIIGDMTDPRRLMFIEQDPTMTLRLDALLKAYIAYRNQIRRTAG